MTKLNSSPLLEGILYIIGGVLILLYAFNFFQQWLNTLVIIGGFLLIIGGFIKLGGLEKVKQWTRKKNH